MMPPLRMAARTLPTLIRAPIPTPGARAQRDRRGITGRRRRERRLDRSDFGKMLVSENRRNADRAEVAERLRDGRRHDVALQPRRVVRQQVLPLLTVPTLPTSTPLSTTCCSSVF